jgi:MT0933-like antitoxin protein
MGIFDRAKDALSGNEDKIEAAIDKAGDLIDEKTGDKYTEQVDKGQDMAKDALRDFSSDEPGKPA